MAADDAGRHGRRRWFRKPGDEAVPGDPGTETETANSTVDVMTQPEDPVREHDEDSRPEADPAPASAPPRPLRRNPKLLRSQGATRLPMNSSRSPSR